MLQKLIWREQRLHHGPERDHKVHGQLWTERRTREVSRHFHFALLCWISLVAIHKSYILKASLWSNVLEIWTLNIKVWFQADPEEPRSVDVFGPTNLSYFHKSGILTDQDDFVIPTTNPSMSGVGWIPNWLLKKSLAAPSLISVIPPQDMDWHYKSQVSGSRSPPLRFEFVTLRLCSQPDSKLTFSFVPANVYSICKSLESLPCLEPSSPKLFSQNILLFLNILKVHFFHSIFWFSCLPFFSFAFVDWISSSRLFFHLPHFHVENWNKWK